MRSRDRITPPYIVQSCFSCEDLEGGQGLQNPPWKITEIKGVLAILVQIPWKITKPPSQHSMLGHHQHASETPFKWWPAYSGIWILSPLINLKEKQTMSKFFPLRAVPFTRIAVRFSRLSLWCVLILVFLAHNYNASLKFFCLFVCLIWFFTSHQKSFSYKRTGLPWLNQY